MAGAFLSKGLIGVAIHIGTAVVFLITKRDLTGIRKLLLGWGILLFLLPILLWIGSVWLLEGPSIFQEMIRQSLWRFFSPSADHTRPFYSYFIPTFLYLMPWTFLPLVLLWYRWGPPQSREPRTHGSLLWFAVVWFLMVFIGLSLASAKRLLYLGPLYPPFALLSALGWDHLREKFPRVKRLELYGLTVIFLVYIGTYLFFITPSEREQSFQPVFEVVSSQQADGPVYLVNPSEVLRGASFFYLGKWIPVMDAQDLLLGRFEDQPGTTFVIYYYCENHPLLSHLQSKGYHPLFQKKFKKINVCIYSNGPKIAAISEPASTKLLN